MCSCRGISSDRTTCPADRGSRDRDLRAELQLDGGAILVIVVGLLRTIGAGLIVVAILVGLSNVTDPEGVPFFLVFVFLAVLASFADRERFGWIEPPEGDRERSVRG